MALLNERDLIRKLSDDFASNDVADQICEPPDERFKCPACLDIYVRPMICWPCMHVLCEPCIERMANADPRLDQCLICRKFIVQCISDFYLEHRLHAAGERVAEASAIRLVNLKRSSELHQGRSAAKLRVFAIFSLDVFCYFYTLICYGCRYDHFGRLMPRGWEMRFHPKPNGHPYYADHVNRLTTWISPCSDNWQKPPNLKALPPGWEMRSKEICGTQYFANHVRKYTQWQDPRTARFQLIRRTLDCLYAKFSVVWERLLLAYRCATRFILRSSVSSVALPVEGASEGDRETSV